MTDSPPGEQRRVSIDAGQSSTRVRVDEAGGETTADHVFPGIRGDRSTVSQIAELLASHDAWGAGSVAVGLSGFAEDHTAPSELLDAARSLRRAAVAHDSVTGYLGANADAHGVVAAVGTGAVVLGAGPLGSARVDGWGAVLGDAGSAYWIGRAGLDAVLRAHDGRGATTALAVPAERAFGDLAALYLALQADPHRVAAIAAFAPVVTDHAEDDQVAGRIVDRAAEEIIASMDAARRRTGLEVGRGRLSGTGQVLAVPAIRAGIQKHLERRMPGSHWSVPLGTPMDGVAMLHVLSADHPLSSSVFSARR